MKMFEMTQILAYKRMSVSVLSRYLQYFWIRLLQFFTSKFFIKKKNVKWNSNLLVQKVQTKLLFERPCVKSYILIFILISKVEDTLYIKTKIFAERRNNSYIKQSSGLIIYLTWNYKSINIIFTFNWNK